MVGPKGTEIRNVPSSSMMASGAKATKNIVFGTLYLDFLAQDSDNHTLPDKVPQFASAKPPSILEAKHF